MKKNICEMKKNSMIVGRAATGIYLIFKALGVKGKKVLFPANICYAAIYPVVYADNIPVFSDVDPKSGNLTLQFVQEKVKNDSDIVALVLPHMYGNPVKEIKEIAEFCKEKNILLIEDCASAMGAVVKGRPVGTFGDYVIYSTGYAKTIELGYGGILTSDFDLEKMEELYRELPIVSEESERNQEFFSKLYRLIRNYKEQTISKYLYQGLYNNVKELYIYRIEDDKEDVIWSSIPNLTSIVETRRENERLYCSLIKKHTYISKYEFQEGAVPWRYNLFVLNEKKALIEYLLKHHVPVSDWYPDVTDIFGIEEVFPNTKDMEEKIINFPLNVEKEEIQRICNVINTFFESRGK